MKRASLRKVRIFDRNEKKNKKKKPRWKPGNSLHYTNMAEEEQKSWKKRRKDLFFVVHGDLNENHGINRVPELDIVTYRLPFVTPFGFPAKKFNKDDNDAHVDSLYEQHYRHCEAHKDC